MEWLKDVNKQSGLTEDVVRITIKHILDGGGIRSLASKLGVSRKTIYYWRRKYPQYDLEIEIAEGRLLFMYERIYFALAVGMDISKEYPGFEQVKVSQIKYQLKRLYPQIYNPRSSKFKNS